MAQIYTYFVIIITVTLDTGTEIKKKSCKMHVPSPLLKFSLATGDSNRQSTQELCNDDTITKWQT